MCAFEENKIISGLNSISFFNFESCGVMSAIVFHRNYIIISLKEMKNKTNTYSNDIVRHKMGSNM